MSFRLHVEARQELREAFRYYREGGAAAAARFLTEARGCIARVRINPHGYARLVGDVRAAHCHGFPYSVVYELYEQQIVVLAIAHQSRDPGYWHHRLPPH